MKFLIKITFFIFGLRLFYKIISGSNKGKQLKRTNTSGFFLYHCSQNLQILICMNLVYSRMCLSRKNRKKYNFIG